MEKLGSDNVHRRFSDLEDNGVYILKKFLNSAVSDFRTRCQVENRVLEMICGYAMKNFLGDNNTHLHSNFISKYNSLDIDGIVVVVHSNNSQFIGKKSTAYFIDVIIVQPWKKFKKY